MSEPILKVYTVENVTAEIVHVLLSQNNQRWLYAERQETTELLWLAEALTHQVPWTHWQYGRVFDAGSELDWWKLEDGRYDIRLLTDTPPPLSETIEWGKATTWEAVGGLQKTLLHGTPDESAWWEARIPRLLHYPIPASSEPAERAVLVTQAYQQNGIVGLTRLLSVEGWKGTKTTDAEVVDE